jgi:CPA2 family monovalent cation:H+ antiporter-2
LGDDITQILLASITLTMVATPLMAYAGGRFSAFLAARENVPVAGVEDIENDLHDHVLIAGFGRVGQTVAKILATGGISYVALDLDAARIAACRAKGLPVFYGNAGEKEILKAAGAGQARAVIVTIDRSVIVDCIMVTLHEFFPDLQVFVRARDLVHGRRLETEGATQAVPETLEASLQLGAIAMTAMGASSDEVIGIIEDLRKDDYENLDDTIHG